QGDRRRQAVGTRADHHGVIPAPHATGPAHFGHTTPPFAHAGSGFMIVRRSRQSRMSSTRTTRAPAPAVNSSAAAPIVATPASVPACRRRQHAIHRDCNQPPLLANLHEEGYKEREGRGTSNAGRPT